MIKPDLSNKGTRQLLRSRPALKLRLVLRDTVYYPNVDTKAEPGNELGFGVGVGPQHLNFSSQRFPSTGLG